MRQVLWAMAVIWPLGAMADVPKVVADIAPVHALVARVMAGVGTPALLLPPGTSPHVNALRPSQAATLETAEVVFWVGPALSPWLEKPLVTVAAGAQLVPLLEAPGTEVRPYRTEADGEDGHDDRSGHVHADGAPDPHAWLDPVNAEAWLAEIAAVLGAADPLNAATFAANATVGQAELESLRANLTADLAGLRDVRLIVYHDAFQYFEARFGLISVGAMTDGESTPSPRHLAELRDLAVEADACIVMEPQADPGLADAVAEGGSARVVTVDPQGRDLPPGVGFYQALMRSLASGLAGCVAGAG